MAGINLIKDKHYKMITTLSDYIGKSVDLEVFKKLKNRFMAMLTPLEIKNTTNIMEISDALKKKGHIAPGEYNCLKEVLHSFNVSLVKNIIEPVEEDIKKMKSAKESQFKSDTGNDVLESKRRILHSILC
jgi:ribosomal protein S8